MTDSSFEILVDMEVDNASGVTSATAEARQYAEAAAQSASDASGYATDAEDAKDAAEAALAEFTSVTASATTLAAGSSATASYSNGHLTLGIPKGDKGDTGATGATGATGNGVQNVYLTGTTGLVDEYTILFTDGTTTTFNVTNGSSISSIAKTSTVGNVDTYTVTLTNGNTTTFAVTNGVDLSSTVAEIQADLLTLLPENIASETTWTDSKYIRHGTGVSVSNQYFDHTDYIDISGMSAIIYTNSVVVTSTQPSHGMAFYDASKTYISGNPSGYGATTGYLEETIITVPNNAVYARFTVLKTVKSGFYVYNYDTAIKKTKYIVDSNVTQTAAKVETIALNSNLWSYGKISNGYLHASSGNLVSSSSYYTTDYIPVGTNNIIYGIGLRYWFYDSNKAIISGATGILDSATELINNLHYVEIPDDAKYFRVTIGTSGEQILYFVSPYDDYLASIIPTSINGLKIYCLGDSITKGMYTSIGDTSSHGPTDYGYPYWIGYINNYTVTNLGRSGAGWLLASTDTSENAMDVVDGNDFSDADYITLAYGVNDYKANPAETLGSINTSTAQDGTVIGSMMYCIETLATSYPSSNIIVLLPMNENRFSSGTLDTNWAFGYTYNDGTLKEYRDAIRACAEYYNVRVIDLEEVCAINRININTCLGDGLHPTIAFYKQMGTALAPLIH